MIGTLKNMIDESNAFRRLCASLPKEEADKLRKLRQKRQREDRKHRQALELAEASRPRNFWGQ